MIDAYRLAQKLHTQLVDETAELQQHVVMTTLLMGAFGADALNVYPILRHTNHTLTTAKEQNETQLAHWHKRIAENLDTIRELEKMFADQDQNDLQAFARDMAERLKAAGAGPGPRTRDNT